MSKADLMAGSHAVGPAWPTAFAGAQTCGLQAQRLSQHGGILHYVLRQLAAKG